MEPVAWGIVGKVGVDEVTVFRDEAERWRRDGCDPVPLYAGPLLPGDGAVPVAWRYVGPDGRVQLLESEPTSEDLMGLLGGRVESLYPFDVRMSLFAEDEQGVNVLCERIAREQSGDDFCDCEPGVAGRCGYCIGYGAADAVLRALGGMNG